MSKNKTIFSCSKCDAQFPKWLGQCSECGAWGTLTQQTDAPATQTPQPKGHTQGVVTLSAVASQNESRISTHVHEIDRVLGGGIVEGSLLLLGGQPGIGKSTIVLQIARNLKDEILYASGEESASQVALRVARLGFELPHMKFVATHECEHIISNIIALKPKLVIIDSIQTLYTNTLPAEPGSVTQVRASTIKLLEVAKQHNIAMIIIGHVTKEGSVAGPKTLEHLVDAVLYLEHSTHDGYRILRSAKNRFGSTDEIGVFEMTTSGLIEVSDPSGIFLSPHTTNEDVIYSVLFEGSRPFMIEVQSLVNKTSFGYPQRKASGFDINRLIMLVAVLSKKTKTRLDTHDIFINVTGGLEISETSADAAICCAIATSYNNTSAKRKICVIGEVGLGGEIRSVPHLSRRIDEAVRFGCDLIITPVSDTIKNKNVHQVRTLSQIIELL
ncbi:DNA repair protein RadA [Candidatus Falkowbacteria bacterium]|nr:DNA repair protein RadA [Candidatus Falkowbacteria bacterium]